MGGKGRADTERRHRKRSRARGKGASRVAQERGLLLQIASGARTRVAPSFETVRQNHEQARATALFGLDAGLSITKIYTVSFVCQARLYLRIVEELGKNGARTAGEIGNRDGQKPENKISCRDKKFPTNLAGARRARPKYLQFYDAIPNQ